MNWKRFGKVPGLLSRPGGGRVRGRVGSVDVAMVETEGHRAGRRRIVPVACYPYRNTVVVSASNGGLGQLTSWYLENAGQRRDRVQSGRQQYGAHTGPLPESEMEEVWQVVVKLNQERDRSRDWGAYLSSTGRCIPRLRLRQLEEAA